MTPSGDLARGEPGYEAFFGFREPPFSLAPNTRFLFASASQKAALAQVTYALERREPVAVVTGEIGTGKTLLCRTMVERLERKTFMSIINDPLLERDELLKQTLQDFGVISKDRTKLAPTSRHELVHALQEFLATLAPLQAHAVLIIDEAQHVQPDVMEQIRLLSNIQDEHGTLLQIILVGQPDLESLLSRPELGQLKQRVARHVRLESLGVVEVAQYIEHRLTVAREPNTHSRTPGAQELARALADWEGEKAGVTFAPDAVAAVSQLSRGIPRVINLLCDRALEEAYAQRVRTVGGSLIQGAARALDLAGASPPPARVEPVEPVADAAAGAPAASVPAAAAPPRRGLLMVAAAAALGAAVVWFGAQRFDRSGGNPPAPATASPEPAPPAPQAAPSSDTAAPPASGAAAPPVPAPAATRPTTAPAAVGGFEIVVASFRTATRANTVAENVSALGLPVRQRTSDGWRQVLAGPFASRVLADEAQRQLGRAGFDETQIVPAP